MPALKQSKSKVFTQFFKNITDSARNIRKSDADESTSYGKFEEVMERVWTTFLKNNPTTASYVGIHDYDHLLGDQSEEHFQQQMEQCQSVLAELKKLFPNKKSFSTWDKQQIINYKMLVDFLESVVKSMELKEHYMVLNSLGGPHSYLPLMSAKMRFRNAHDFEIYQQRLECVPRYFDQCIELMRAGLKSGITPCKTSMLGVEDQIDGLLALEVTPYHRPIVEKFDAVCKGTAAAALKQSLNDVIANKVFPAYKKLREFIVTEYTPNVSEVISAEDRLPNGKEYYAFKLKESTSTNKTAQEVHDLGLGEVKRIKNEMLKIANDAGYEGDDAVDRYAADLQKNPKYMAKTEEELLNAYRAASMIVYPKLPDLFGKLPRTPFGIRAIPAFIAENSAGAYYEGPPPDGSQPGWFNANCSHLEDRKLYQVDALVLHEAIPGHHMQIALSVENDDLPMLRKFSISTAYVEGWGLYSESLGKELGLYLEPTSWFGRLGDEMLRATRLVVDTGMHSLGWTKKQAMDFMLDNKAGNYTEIDAETTRYLSIPGQACAYKIGELEIHALRKYATEKLGDKFEIREFHDLVLSVGGVPLTILSEVVHDWVDEKLK